MERIKKNWPLTLLFIFVLPKFASAQVVINEVMYNPQGSDTGREWVELYNQGSADVAMAGGSGKGSWRINDGSNHTLTDPAGGTGRGTLTIPAGGYLVVAYDPNEFISGEYAGGSYSVVKSSISLNNNGATATLLDGTGATVDAVSYTPTQGGNDDGSSLQRQADGSWVAALPTPGAANSTTPYVAPATDDAANSSEPEAATTTQAQTQAQVAATPSYVPPPTPSLYADAGGDRSVIVGADVEFDASAYDKSQQLIDPSTVRFVWNFGDGSSAEGAAVLHHYEYPGRYAAVLEIAKNKNAAADQITVTAQPAALSFSLLQDGGVDIQDLAGHDLDLSGWIVREDAGPFASLFQLPDDSKVLSGSAMEISPETLSFRASSSTMLEYPNGAFALAVGQGQAATPGIQDEQAAAIATQVSSTANVVPTAKKREPKARTSSTAASAPLIVDQDPDSDVSATQDASSSQPLPTSTILETAAVAESPVSKYLGWFGVGALVLAVVAAVVAASHYKKGEWDIVEETEE